eukprot:1192468-Prorocentrum_minimum.AAC.1
MHLRHCWPVTRPHGVVGVASDRWRRACQAWMFSEVSGRVAHASNRVRAAGRGRKLSAQSADNALGMVDEVFICHPHPPV